MNDLTDKNTEKSLDARPIVVVDIDGVLFDTPVDAVAAANTEHSTTYTSKDIFNHNAEHDKDKFIINGEDQFHKYQHDTTKYREVEGAKQALERLSKRAKIVALTSRDYAKFAKSTRQVINEHFGNIITEVYFTTEPTGSHHKEKGKIIQELGGSVLVDDAVKYCESAVAHGVAAILLSQPYNKVGHSFPLQASNWNEAVRLIEHELDN